MEKREHPRYGKYQLLERIGIGGMAEVFKAKVFGAEGFERLIAIKRILPHLVEDEDFVNMFIDEAKIAVCLNHPNIVAINDLGKIDGTLFIAMEYVLGKDLRAVYDYEARRGGTPPMDIACHVVMKMCEALHHAHFATGPRGEPLKVIHRDVSPQNVLLSFDGEVKVADFGLAKARGRMVQTQSGVVKGKLAYMSPEQLRGEEIDHRVDVFGLGIILFELLTGKRLFLGPSDMDTLRRVYDARVPPMRELNPRIHPDLEAIALKALAKDRDARYTTALELHDDLQAFAYQSGLYAGASALRRYLREAFPDVAPAEDLPPFAVRPESDPAPPPPPTVEPPARRAGRAEATLEHVLLPPSVPASEDFAPGYPPIPFHSEAIDAGDIAYEIEDDEVTTDRPAPLDLDGVVASAPHPESSQVQPSDRGFPSEPPGVYVDEHVTEQPYDAGHDTNPAPAPLVPDDTESPFPDEASNLKAPPTGVPMYTTEDNPDDDPWGGDSTVVVDPRSAEGNG